MNDSTKLEAAGIKGPEQQLMTFPCEFAIKAMGRSSPKFEEQIKSLVLPHVSEDKLLAISTNPSKAGNFVSVTIRIMADSRLQLDAIYYALTDCDEVLMAL